MIDPNSATNTDFDDIWASVPTIDHATFMEAATMRRMDWIARVVSMRNRPPAVWILAMELVAYRSNVRFIASDFNFT